MFICKFINSNNYDNIIFEFIGLTKMAGWKMSSSSDGIAYEIEHSGKDVNGLGNNFAWFILTMPSGKELLFQRGKKHTNWWLSYSPMQGLTKGSTISRPYAMDEGRLLHDSFGRPISLSGNISKWCFGVSDSSEAFYFIAMSEINNVCIFLAMDEIKTYEDSSALMFGTSYTSKQLFYFENGKCENKIIDNWVFGSNYKFESLSLDNGSLHKDMLYVDNLLLPWASTDCPTPAPATITTEIKIETKNKQLLKNNNINYKMIGQLYLNGQITYHSWVVKGFPDFTGEMSKVAGLTNIYVADKWKAK